MEEIKRIAVLTSGGDAPGMNAAIRAVVRSGISHGLEVFGIVRGYDGLIGNEIKRMQSQEVSNILQTGGTILKTARSEEFMTLQGRKKAYDNLISKGINGLIVIGGDGSFAGASRFAGEHNFAVVGIPGTIDNDLYGTDYTIGYDTALNNVVDAVDKIRDTASSHNRIFFVEVMGREAGFIALRSGIATGAEAILIPEVEGQVKQMMKTMTNRGEIKKSSIIIVAEGEREASIWEMADMVRKELPGSDVRVSILGHIQRGGRPTAYDRVSASRMGVAAVDALLNKKNNVMVGLVNNKITLVPLSKTIKLHKEVNRDLLAIVDLLV
ncbi:MAG TPA: 6-phosphofructokinase [Lentimicrobium sp.]|jgi:6-phosphofructokinase 1|nr:6-phosphofructokinase [Lentimicrobium sp.]